jgi:iron-sulfur cluster assembly accessory protein
MTAPENTEPTLTLSSAAAANIRGLLVEKAMNGHYLRVYVAGLGCSGPQYGLAFDISARETDTVIESDGVKILVDPNSMAYLDGATIDYVDSPQGPGFRIENTNPMVASACGSCSGSCG